MEFDTQQFLKARRDRLLGTILGQAERETFRGKTNTAEYHAFRANVMSAVNQYHETMLDLIKSKE